MMDQQQRPGSQKFLAGVLNPQPHEEHRDSAYFSSNDASSSKHTSTGSGMGVLSPSNSSYQISPIDKTPSPTTANNHLPQPLVSPINGNMSVSSMISPTTPGSADQRQFNRHQSFDSAPNSATFAMNGDHSEDRSRRESVDSRIINQGFNDMRLGNPNSPYASHNHSTTSIHNTLQQQRNPRPGFDTLAPHRISNGYQPSAERNPGNPDGQPRMQRVAPAITGPTTSQIARAAEPTKGEAWAFPEPEIQRLPSGANQQYLDSRRSSIAESLASSQYTTESRLPPGQRRLDESHDFQRLSNASGEFPAVHHHSLQHRQIGDLQNEEIGSHAGGQPYSRTPELRISHKLAERKRRTEMKELFEQLRDMMPQERGSKASKWEILTKAIAEHQKQASQISQLQAIIGTQSAQIEQLKHELQELHMENQRLGRPGPLPPLRLDRLHPSPPGSNDSMTGVQYEPARVNGYRPVDPGARF
ncbi:hypothetical protein V8F20_000008 [Naviculisporaceae sp. PSN 640]